MTLKKQLTGVFATGLLVAQIMAPGLALADTTLVISGNGTDTHNDVQVEQSNTTQVMQSNNAIVTNTVTSNASTGGNTAKDNTGGNVTIDTGDANVNSTVTNELNSNAASVNCCGSNDTSVLVSGNGSDSHNDVHLDINDNKDPATSVTQENTALVTNVVDTNAETGANTAKDNTGGTVKILTGDANVTSHVSTTANANQALIGGGAGQGGAGSLSAVISGNGSDSHNDIHLDVNDGKSIWQANQATVTNHVDANAKTGYNEAEDNTGGSVIMATGDANATIGIDNSVNFNSAEVDCGCLTDVLAKIVGNGEDSHSDLYAELGNLVGVYQGGEKYGNHALLTNIANASPKTGANEAEDNTGPVLTDPTYVFTGDANSTVNVDNSGNVNSYGAEMPMEWPDFGNVNFTFSFSLADLMAYLHHA